MTTKPRKATTRPRVVDKGTVGKPQDRKQPEPTTPTSASNWKKSGAVLTLPSGNVVRVKNPGIMGMAHAGMVPNGLMSLIMDSVQKGSEPKAEELFSADLKVDEMFQMIDSAVLMMVVEPEIHSVPDSPEERNPDLLYIDDINEEDKMFLWQWSTGGTTDVEQFRKESRDVLGSLSGLQNVGDAAK